MLIFGFDTDTHKINCSLERKGGKSMRKMFCVNFIKVAISIGAPEGVISPKGWDISEWENFFISRRDKEGQTPANKTSSEAARTLLKWAGACRASLDSFANEIGAWVFTFRFETAKDASEFLRDAEMLILNTVRG